MVQVRRRGAPIATTITSPIALRAWGTPGAAQERARELVYFLVIPRPLDGEWTRIATRMASQKMSDAHRVVAHGSSASRYSWMFSSASSIIPRQNVLRSMRVCPRTTVRHWVMNGAK